MNATYFRGQIHLDPGLYRWVKQSAFQENKSFAQIVRETLEKERGQREQKEAKRKAQAGKQLLSLVGKFNDKNRAADVSINHDKYLGEALYQEVVNNRKRP